jgi:hypothetical protein
MHLLKEKVLFNIHYKTPLKDIKEDAKNGKTSNAHKLEQFILQK